MSELPADHIKAPDALSKSKGVSGPTSAAKKRGSGKKKGPNYAQLHAKPLPLEIYPLPAFHPSQPLSLLRLAYVYISQLLNPPISHPATPYRGYFSPETRSVHVTDPQHIRALWEMGFFGKGTLSRSEPSWLDREIAKLKAESGGKGGGTAEEATRARREERRLFKLERARVEREAIERQKAIEEGLVAESAAEDGQVGSMEPTLGLLGTRAESDEHSSVQNGHLAEPIEETSRPKKDQGRSPDPVVLPAAADQPQDLPIVTLTGINGVEKFIDEIHVDLERLPAAIESQEHLQLTLEEAFFLVYGLGVLSVTTLSTSDRNSLTISDLLVLFGQPSAFPPLLSPNIRPDNRFLLKYVVYHHFRSLGWVVRPGIKFSADYLLYNRGPVFSHAEFAVLILPSYSDPHWASKEGLRNRRIKEQKDWWWLHCVNRVQSQVRKTLVLAYVDIPAPSTDTDKCVDIGKLLRRYRVREFTAKRWLANRSRD